MWGFEWGLEPRDWVAAGAWGAELAEGGDGSEEAGAESEAWWAGQRWWRLGAARWHARDARDARSTRDAWSAVVGLRLAVRILGRFAA